jgi:hypothetical protein
MTQADIDSFKCPICKRWFWDSDLDLSKDEDKEKIIKFHKTAKLHKYAEKNLTYTYYTEEDRIRMGHKPTKKSVQMAINFNKEIME